LKPVLLNLKEKYSKSFYPYKNLVIDESIMLCDGETGFILDLIIYTGSTTEIKFFPSLGISGSLVMTLMEKYLHVGHVLYLDN